MGRTADRRRQKLLRDHKRKGGHPQRVAELRAKMDKTNPDTMEERRRAFEARGLGRFVRDESMRNDAEGILVGLSAAVGRFLAPILANQWGLEDPEDVAAIVGYLTEKNDRALARMLEEDVSPIDYRDWRLACLQAVSDRSARV